jgi:hypothetical protein
MGRTSRVPPYIREEVRFDGDKEGFKTCARDGAEETVPVSMVRVLDDEVLEIRIKVIDAVWVLE